MADRRFLPPLGHLEVGVVRLYVKIVVGAAGAVTSGTGAGITSVTKESTDGQYTILLTDAYGSLLHPSITLLDDTGSDPTTVAVTARVLSEDVASAKTVVIQGFALDDGAAANFASGATVYVALDLKNSSVTTPTV